MEGPDTLLLPGGVQVKKEAKNWRIGNTEVNYIHAEILPWTRENRTCNRV
jgi:hypothetical protein